ncbi:MAG: hypothetical protein E6Q58_02600 [Niabella sp.]|nr:MAG: hypothetical protein E6Q58_02600 [Niabella sp.]
MKNLFKKGAVATAVAGSLMISGVASADSVLAPLVIGLDNGAQTFFSIKARGTGAVNARMTGQTDLHYVWFKKGNSLTSLANLSGKCEVSNNNGRVSPWDLVLQRAVDNDADVNLDADDASVPNGYSAGDFVGFAVITDNANKNANPAVKDLANEGELSGFGYVVDAANSFVLDYKLLNNHRSKIEGDFSAGFISKKSVDFSWMPVDIAATEWLTVVTGEDMLKADSGAGEYDATVKFSQDTLAGSVSPQLPFGGSGVYDNDEKVTSGGKNFNVTCMGVFGREQLLNTLQLSDTIDGGWKRMSIGAVSGTNQVASGAIVYKAEAIDFSTNVRAEAAISKSVFGTGKGSHTNLLNTKLSDAESYNLPAPDAVPGLVISFQPETSGHLSSTPEPHPNRPY